MRIAVMISLAGLVVGCVDQLAARQAYLAQFVGRPEVELIQAMGVPARNYETGGVKYLAYEEKRVDVLPTAPMYGSPYWGWGGGMFPPQVVNYMCETTIAISSGVVRSFVLRGNACG